MRNNDISRLLGGLLQIPAIEGISDTGQARVMLYQSGRPVHSPLTSVAPVQSVNGQTGDVVLDTDDLAGISTFMRTVLDDANAGAALTTLGITAFAQTLLDDTTASASRTTLELGTAARQAYASGTFTPALTFGGGSTGLTFSSQSGRYVKVSKLMVFQIDLTLSAKGSSTGAALVTGLPAGISVVVGGSFSMLAGSMTALNEMPRGWINSSGQINLVQVNGGGTGAVPMTDANFTDTTRLAMAGAMYTADAEV